jgi:hypothetical protein
MGAVFHHTPGPWRASIYGGWDTPRVWSDQGAVAMLIHHESGPGEAEANALLIAAAPDLLAALRQTLQAMIQVELSDSSRREWEAAQVSAREALRKVLGMEP